MTRNLITVSPEDTLQTIQEIFTESRIHHIPVVSKRKLVGIISDKDFNAELSNFSTEREFHYKKQNFRAKDIMTTKLAKLDDYDRINVAIEVFKKNYFHSLPVVDAEGNLVGIVTTHDLIVHLSQSEVTKEYA